MVNDVSFFQLTGDLFYRDARLHHQHQQIIKLNPMYWYITGFRRTLMWGIPLDLNMFAVCGICAVVSMWVGVHMFRKTQDRFVLHI